MARWVAYRNVPKFRALARLTSVSARTVHVFQAQRPEFRPPVSVRNFPIPVFAAPAVPETYLFFAEIWFDNGLGSVTGGIARPSH
jgi:hypothetical protein